MNVIPDHISWFFGVVEDRMDPYMLGRLRVRVIGYHPFNRNADDVSGLPVEDLPWMTVLMPTTSASISGIAGSVTGAVEGTHVFGLWLDKHKTNGIVLGTTAGYFLEKPNPDEGFSDPNGVYPTVTGPTVPWLTIGGETGSADSSNLNQDGQQTYAINPAQANASPGEHDVYSDDLVKQILKHHLGQSNTLKEHKRGWIIGVQHIASPPGTKKADAVKALDEKLSRETNGTILLDEMEKLFHDDLTRNKAEVQKHAVVGPIYSTVNGARRVAIEVLSFSLGGVDKTAVAHMLKMYESMKVQKWDEAYDFLMGTQFAKNYPDKARRIAQAIKYGNLTSWGVPNTTQVPQQSPEAPSGNTAYFIGDSIAVGAGKMKEREGQAVIGKNPSIILGWIRSLKPKLAGKRIVLSTGYSNGVTMTGKIQEQLDIMKELKNNNNSDILVMGVANDYCGKKNRNGFVGQQMNNWLKQECNKRGLRFHGGFQSTDAPKLHANDYKVPYKSAGYLV